MNQRHQYTIVVGVDGSPASKSALRWAAWHAEQLGGTLATLMAWEVPLTDLIAVGNRGRGGITEALLGSVSQHVVHHARCPVVVIRDYAR
ncbi:universal stress protein [Saccharopolyspora sp. TS4A08]|uniref:Universal stress protein n=1 Tax=Saccharopolyspora ipomoeae TaxID=3042027 RepID=A0ABT6PQN9_9PSEU|nr:universal stress protein [Saccharopolyspora sp. TS4A08]MDI2030249.1 universal stress protein [Saccharopolyspora sp. TS4A08]